MKPGLKQRARKEEDKLARREAILETAATMLGRRQFATITMAEVARRCGLAKGTLYLYFKSKEELFLATLEREITTWFDDLNREIFSRGPLGVETFARMFAADLATREMLMDLLTILHSVLEQNIETEVALRFKQMLRSQVELGGRELEAALPGLPAGTGHRLLLRFHAFVVGMRQMADPSPTVAAVLQRDELAILRVSFEDELATTVAALIHGTIASARLST